MHPTPNAGIILTQRMTVAPRRSPLIALNLSAKDTSCCRLWKSSPSRCTGAATSCENTGTVICVIKYFVWSLAAMLSGIAAVKAGAIVKDPKMVTASLRRNVPVAVPENLTGVRLPLWPKVCRLPNIWAKRVSFHIPNGTFTNIVDAKVAESAAPKSSSLETVCDPLAVA